MSEAAQERVLEVVRELLTELGGGRALRAAAPEASLERDLGLGSLERVELLLRLESAFGRTLDERCLQIDTPAGLARVLLEGGGGSPRGTPDRASRPSAPGPAAALSAAATVHEVLWRRAQAEPDRPHVYLREDGGEVTITYGQLLSEAAAIAGGLRERGVRRGETVALMLPTGMDFLRCFQGILVAGAIPVPIYPPVRLDRLEEYAQRQSAILADAGVRMLVTIEKARPIAALLRPAVPSLAEVTTPSALTAGGASWAEPEGRGSDPAFIQYTSGSTGRPKGVLLTHDNLLANIRAIAAGLDAQPTDVGASWLPLYHDMGLIGSWLFCLRQGIPLALMSPQAFLSRPERWLWTIHERRATLSPAPNFAYELCARRIPDAALEGLDLSSWRCALNGAEPVSPDTLERFAHRFAPYGFRREALMPVYGLAENSVALCVPPPGRGPRITRVSRAPFEGEGRAEPAAEDDATALRFVSVGSPLPEHEVRLLDESGGDVRDGSVGRLVFRGPSMMQEYFRQPEATAAIRVEGGWLDSGDLAFRADGEIHIAGRRKDLIIKAGRNLVPQEIEEVAATVEGIRKGCVAAFGVDHPRLGTEGLVVVAETRQLDAGRRETLAAAVTDRVAAAIGVPPDDVAIVPPGAVPKTSSGKVRRAETKRMYLAGALGRARPEPRGRRARLLAAAAWSGLRPRLALLPQALYAVWLAVLAVALALCFWVPAMLLPGRRSAAALGRAAAWVLVRFSGVRARAEGIGNLGGGGPFVLAANHCSYADVPVLMALLPLDFLFVAKKEVLSYPLVGAFVRKTGHLTVDREDAQQSVADAGEVARALEAGRSVLFFPEGTFSAAAGLRPFRLGAFKLAVDTGVCVVPLALRGTRHVLRAGRRVPRPGPVSLWIGAPVSPAGEGWRSVVALRDRVADAVAAHCGEPRLDLVAAGPIRS
ncbi:MAG TPA: AMP-binding protein [Vicinamibacteria bacterium]